jgi:hypothetical protein
LPASPFRTDFSELWSTGGLPASLSRAAAAQQ